jgi:flavin-dependent dehydrogenase
MWDVLISGAGPAGSVAATVLARAGARVLIVDRESFPRDKLCGDSVNPGALAILRRLSLSRWIETHGCPTDGMLLTGPRNSRVEGRYPESLRGRVVMRRDFDRCLLDEAIAAGAQFEDRVFVRGPVVEPCRGARGVHVRGVHVRSARRADIPLPAQVTIAADGRRSTLAFALGLASHPVRPRRWAIGAYFEGVSGTSSLGEMHVRAGEYLGIAPLDGGLTNACFVGSRGSLAHMRSPERTLRAAIERDSQLRERFSGARLVAPPAVLGPLAVDVQTAGVAGLLLAGDAAGFVDPITGDGLRFALRGGELAAETALQMLQTGDSDGHIALARRRREAFAWKWRLNRTLRRIVDSPVALSAGVAAASVAPAIIRSLIAVAGDCHSTAVEQC